MITPECKNECCTPRRKLPTRRKNVPTYVYRCYDAEGALLYVGCSNQPRTRVGGHRENAWWGSRISSVRYMVFPDSTAALRAEATAIDLERPACNLKGRWHQLGDRSHWTLNDYRTFLDALTHMFEGNLKRKWTALAVKEAEARFGVSLLRPAS